MGKSVPNELLSEFAGFVEAEMGLSFPPEKRADLARGVLRVCEECGHPDPEAFIRQTISSPLSRDRVEELAAGLTVGETYFFREKKALDAFEELAIGRWLRERRGADRQLRIWCAGCASGEEAYTVAMLLMMLIPDLKDWQVSIVATDINPRFLEKARAGVYTKWSFRDVPTRIIDRFFTPHGSHFEIVPEVRRLVEFSFLNLKEGGFAALPRFSNLDAIFCRNVLMYFAPDTIREVARNFHDSLADGGYLLVSQTELNDECFPGFGKASHQGGLIYRKTGAWGKPLAGAGRYHVPPPSRTGGGWGCPTQASPHPHPVPPLEGEGEFLWRGGPAAVAPVTVSTVPFPFVGSAAPARRVELEPLGAPEDLLPAAEQALACRAYGKAETLLLRHLADHPGEASALARLARICADQGRHDEAKRHIEGAVAADGMQALYHYLQAAILTEQGDKREASAALRRALYLDPDFALAYVALGNLALGAGNRAEAERHFNYAVSLLKRYGPGDQLPEAEGMTAGSLIEAIESRKPRTKGER